MIDTTELRRLRDAAVRDFGPYLELVDFLANNAHAIADELDELRKRVAEASDWIERHLSSDEPPSEWDEGYQQACFHLRGILADGKETA